MQPTKIDSDDEDDKIFSDSHLRSNKKHSIQVTPQQQQYQNHNIQQNQNPLPNYPNISQMNYQDPQQRHLSFPNQYGNYVPPMQYQNQLNTNRGRDISLHDYQNQAQGQQNFQNPNNMMPKNNQSNYRDVAYSDLLNPKQQGQYIPKKSFQ